MEQALSPDLTEARRFLDLLEVDGLFHFQTAHESSRLGETAPRVLHGKFLQVQDELVELNLLGAAVWVQINDGSSRRDADVREIRAYFVDQDDGGAELLFGSPHPADVIVESSPGKHHGYWLTRSTAVDLFPSRQKALADRFTGDRKVCNAGRVMRLPGFIHHKAEPFISRIVKVGSELVDA